MGSRRVAWLSVSGMTTPKFPLVASARAGAASLAATSGSAGTGCGTGADQAGSGRADAAGMFIRAAAKAVAPTVAPTVAPRCSATARPGSAGPA
jgi:hypothetical protein